MTDSENKTDSNKEAPNKTKPSPKTKKALVKQKTPKQKSGSGIAWLAIVLVIVVAGGGYQAFNQLQQQIAQLSDRYEPFQEGVSKLSNQFATETERLNSEILNSAKKLTDTSRISNEKITLLEKQVGKSSRQWLVSEAEYLANLANTRLELLGDVDTAIIALQAADQRLKENGDPMTFAVRKQLAKEINLLKSVELPDTVGLSSQLLALEQAVSNMDITEPHAGTAQAPETGKGDTSPIPENLQQTLNDAWDNFSKLIVVRRSEQPLAALMTPEQVELIRKSLSLKLESARFALIDKNEALYTASISTCIEWLNNYFDANNPAVKTAVEQLNTLKNTAITATMPSIALSLNMLRDLPILAIPEKAEVKVVAPKLKESAPSTPEETPAADSENNKASD